MAGKKSVALNRHVQGYPNIREYNLYAAYMKVEGLSQTDALTDIIRGFFAAMTESRRAKYITKTIHNTPPKAESYSWPV